MGFFYLIWGWTKLGVDYCFPQKRTLSDVYLHSLTLKNLSIAAKNADLTYSLHEEDQILTALAIGPNSRAAIGTSLYE